jgi:hypothetical protein
MTNITDASLELLGRMTTLEKLEFWQCMYISDKGVSYLAALPYLRGIDINQSPNVSLNILRLFGTTVRVSYRS